MTKKIRLTELNKKDMTKLSAGAATKSCVCGCAGNSSTVDNGLANRDGGGLQSPGGGSIMLPDADVVFVGHRSA
ncbi:MAG: hypothetical protein GY765_20165 [bacterium]|nr:hypothetical protein [bacterium]